MKWNYQWCSSQFHSDVMLAPLYTHKCKQHNYATEGIKCESTKGALFQVYCHHCILSSLFRPFERTLQLEQYSLGRESLLFSLRKGHLQSAILFPYTVDSLYNTTTSLEWRHNGPDSVSNHQPHGCLLRRRSRKISKLRVTGLCAGNSPVTSEFPAQMASNAENISI